MLKFLLNNIGKISFHRTYYPWRIQIRTGRKYKMIKWNIDCKLLYIIKKSLLPRGDSFKVLSYEKKNGKHLVSIDRNSIGLNFRNFFGSSFYGPCLFNFQKTGLSLIELCNVMLVKLQWLTSGVLHDSIRLSPLSISLNTLQHLQ